METGGQFARISENRS